MHIVRFENASLSSIKSRETEGVSRNFIGAALSRASGPQAYIAELAPGSRIPSHFHDVDQFQVFVRGTGRIGKDTWHAGIFHYADAFTPYGPLVPDPGSEMHFFTLRPAAASGVFRMPDSRELIGNRRGRNVVSNIKICAAAGPELVMRVEPLMSLRDDGVAGDALHIPADMEFLEDAPATSTQFAIVLTGAIHVGSDRLGPLSLICVEPGEKMPPLVAPGEGAVVLRLRFGNASDRPGSDPGELEKRDMDAKYMLPDDY